MSNKDSETNLINQFNRFIDSVKEIFPAKLIDQTNAGAFAQLFHTVHTPALLLSIPDGLVLDVNISLLNQLEYSSVEIVGKTLIESDIWGSFDLKKEASGQLNQPESMSLKLKTKSGRLLEFKLDASKVELISGEAFLCVLESKARDDSIQDFVLKFESIVDNSDHGVCVVVKSKHLYVNKRFSEITGLPLEYIYDVTPDVIIKDISHPDFYQIVISSYREFISEVTSNGSVELKIVHPDDGEKWVEIQARLMNINGDRVILMVLIDIDEKKKAYEKIRSDQHLFKSILDTTLDYVFIKNEELRYTLVNTRMEKLFGKSSSELLGKTDVELFDKETAAQISATDTLVLKGEVIEEECEKVINGKVIAFHIVKTPLFNKAGRIVGLYSVARDITEQRDSRQRLEDSELKFRNIIENTKDTILTYQPDGTISYISPGNNFYGYDLDKVVGSKVFEYVYPDDLKKVAAGFQETLLTGRGFTSEFRLVGGENDRIFYVEESICAIRENDKIIQLSGVIRDVSKRKIAEAALRESETKYRRLIENMNEGLGAINEDGIITFVNNSACRMLGYTQDELVNKSVMELVDEDDRKILTEQFMQRKKGDRANYEITWLKNDGSKVHTIMSSVPVYDRTGDFSGSFGILTDITDRKNAEEALKKSEERYRQAVENSPSPIFTVDKRGFIRTWNTACANVFGYDETIIGEYYELIIAEKSNYPLITEKINEVFQNKYHADIELKLKTREGRVRFMVSRLYPLLDEKGEVERCVFTNTDITDRKDIENALRESEKRFRDMVELSPEGVFEYDSNGEISFANAAALKIFHLTPELLESGLRGESLIVPEERERARKNMSRLLNGEKIGPNEYRVIRPDGSIFRSVIHSTPVYKNDKIVGVHGIIIDITENKKSEAALRESELFNRAVIDKSPLGVSVRSKSGKLLSCNDSWKKIWGKSDQEVEKYLAEPDRPSLVFDRRDDYLTPWHNQLRRVYEEGGYLFAPEVKLLYHKKGGDRWVSQHFYAITDSEGQVDKVVILTEDITERKRATEALKLSEAYYRGLFESAHDAIIVFDPENEIILDANKSAYLNYGFEKSEFIGMSMKDISKDVKTGQRHISKTLRNKSYYSFETIQYHKNGMEMILEVNASIIKYNGRDVILSVNRDITQRKKAQEELRLSEERFRTIVNSAPISIFAMDTDGIMTFLEGHPLENAGMHKDTIIGTSIFDIYPHPDGRKLYRQALEGKLNKYLASYNGRLFDINLTTRKNETGKTVGIIGTATDVTESLQDKEALRQSEKWLRTIVTASTLTLFAISKDGYFTFLEGRLLKTLGFDKDKLIGESVFDIFETDFDDDIWEQSLEGKIRNHVFNYRDKIIEARYSPQTNDKNEMIGVYGVALDITEQKKIEDALRDGEEKYRLLVEAAGQPIYSLNRDGIFLTMNNVAAEYLGGKPKDFIGKTMWNLFPKNIADVQMADVIKAIDTGKKLTFESPTLFKNEEKWFITSIQPLQDAEGAASSALLISSDITQRKRIEVRDRAKSQYLDDLRRAQSINECLALCCRTIRDAKIFKRSILTIHDEKRAIVNYGQVGLSEMDIKHTLGTQAPDSELTRRMTREKFKISHSYYIPESEGMFSPIENRCINQAENTSADSSGWKNGDAYFVPLKNDNDQPEGWLSADTPFSGFCPDHDDVVFIEELVDTAGNKIREIRYLELLETEREALREKNITLREVLAYIEEEKMEIKNQIANEVQNSLMPLVKKLINPDGKVNNTCYNILSQGLDSLVAPSSIKQIYSKLSPREIEICNLIKSGATSKDIANELSISLATVQKHRESIRKKLKITNKNINLMTFLKG